MRAAPDRAALNAYHAELAAAFMARRCACGAQADCVLVGRGAVWDRNLCLACLAAIPVGGSVDRAGA